MAHVHAASEEHVSGFWRHFAEMLAAMAVGMFMGTAIFVTVMGMTWDEVLVRYPTAILLVMAISMTVPMVMWMRHRGHGWTRSSEMAAAMVVPVVPFLCLVWFGVTKSALCGAYCGVTVVTMLGLMLYRRSDYTTHAM